ncbi:hypothetical protein BN59_02863 [Legionella massiliensis]|uniref:Ankyrin repeats (3 copies) n=1 Tax=Legionella massiliensis TaxID=1034943 RepID=A0A078L3N2_9GAMM|nr:ankyrin repeat domain-containing protein [Legionella massiliensis]CDZ78553.1 hypothetical protein BN59_02863 [Legionella massiliensis]CEE14291.1 hypothetical protein BN1094_02863 [Legionella massiliensis]
MPRELAIKALKQATDVTIPAILADNVIDNKFLDEKLLTSKIFLLSQQNKPHVSLLEQEVDEEAFNVVTSYKEAMRKAVGHIELVSKNNLKLIPKDIRGEILGHLQKDNAVLLEHLLKQSEHAPGILEDYNYALRVAANGAIRCLTHLLSTRIPDIMDPGPKSGRIALDYAIENGHPSCVAALLKAKNTLDFYNPAGQLLYGKSPNRPIDKLQTLAEKDDEKAASIRKIILDVFKGPEGRGSLTSERQVSEIKQIIAKQQVQHRAYELA